MSNLKSEHKLTNKGVTALVLAIILLSFVLTYVGGILFSTTVTVAQTTSTDVRVTTVTSSNISSFTMTSIVVRTTSQLVTVTETGPDRVQFSGSVTTKTLGTTPTDVLFVSARNNATRFDAKVQTNQYSVSIPNQDYYNIFIVYTSVIPGKVLDGQCSAGAIVLFTLGATQTANWSC